MPKRIKPEIVDVAALRAALVAAEARADQATQRADEAQAAVDRVEAEAAAVKARLSGDAALIAHLRLEIARLTRTLYGQRSERTQRLIDQYELQLEELEASAAADALAAENRGGQRAAFFNSLIVTAKLNDVDPQAWLADVLGRIASHPAQRLTELLPWNWTSTSAAADLDAAA